MFEPMMDLLRELRTWVQSHYEVLKDFQTFGAAIVALFAAGVAYCSAQRVKTREFRHELAIREADRHRACIALLSTIRERLRSLSITLTERRAYLEQFLPLTDPQAPHTHLSHSSAQLAELTPLFDNYFGDIKWTDTKVLDAADQRAIYEMIDAVLRHDTRFTILRERNTTDEHENVEVTRRVNESIGRAQGAIYDAENQIQRSLENLLSRRTFRFLRRAR